MCETYNAKLNYYKKINDEYKIKKYTNKILDQNGG